LTRGSMIWRDLGASGMMENRWPGGRPGRGEGHEEYRHPLLSRLTQLPSQSRPVGGPLEERDRRRRRASRRRPQGVQRLGWRSPGREEELARFPSRRQDSLRRPRLSRLATPADRLPAARVAWGCRRTPRVDDGRIQARVAPRSASQTADPLSDGARQSLRGDSDPPKPTFGALGSAVRLNWLRRKKRSRKTSSHRRISSREYRLPAGSRGRPTSRRCAREVVQVERSPQLFRPDRPQVAVAERLLMRCQGFGKGPQNFS